jgi:hypothetical protein
MLPGPYVNLSSEKLDNSIDTITHILLFFQRKENRVLFEDVISWVILLVLHIDNVFQILSPQSSSLDDAQHTWPEFTALYAKPS